MNWNLIWGTVSFIFSKFIDVNDPFLSEDLDDFTLVSFMISSQDNDLIIFSNWEGSETVLFSKIL